MTADKLIGKLAIRTAPVNLSLGTMDYSYSHTPIRILKVTDSHIVMNHVGTKEESLFGNDSHILDSRWVDDNWTSYEDLMEGLENE